MTDSLRDGGNYEAQLAHARSLYHADQQPSNEELAETVRLGLGVAERRAVTGSEGYDSIQAREALSELVKRGFGHVPVESFAAAMTALDDLRATAKKVTEAYYDAGGDMTGELGEALDALDIRLGEESA